MKDQPEALRLADYMDDALNDPNDVADAVSAELRRLHQFAEDQIGRATAAEAALQMTKATHALKIAAVETQRDALLETLKAAVVGAELRREGAVDVDVIRAAIKAVEGEKT